MQTMRQYGRPMRADLWGLFVLLACGAWLTVARATDKGITTDRISITNRDGAVVATLSSTLSGVALNLRDRQGKERITIEVHRNEPNDFARLIVRDGRGHMRLIAGSSLIPGEDRDSFLQASESSFTLIDEGGNAQVIDTNWAQENCKIKSGLE